jgi:hypothetical protein
VGVPPFNLPTAIGDALLDNLLNADPLATETAVATASALKKAGFSDGTAAAGGATAGALQQGGMSFMSMALAFLLKAASPLLVKFLQLLTKFRTENQAAFKEISEAVLGEFLATDIKLAPSPPGQSGDATIATCRAIGDALYTRLEKEFAPGGTPASINGEKAAHTFSGYAVNFSVQNAILGAMADGLSFHHLTQIREIGEDVAKNLGLGRLQRRALGPLLDNTIAKPYDRQLRAKYRQDAISEAQLVKAFNRGKLSEADVRKHLAEKGYPDDQITELVHQLTSHLTDAEVNLLLRYGVIDEATAVQMLVDEGWPEATARTKLKVLQTQKLDTLEGQYVNAWETICVDRRIDDQTFLDGLNSTHLSDAEKEWERKYVSIKRENPHTDPTLAQMQGFYADGLITLDDWDQFLKAKGYDSPDRFASPDVQFWLTLEMLKKAADANAKAAKGKVKLLTIAQLTKAYKGGTISQQQLQDYLAGEGYAAADVFRLIAQILGSVGTPAALQAAADLNAQAEVADLAPEPS